MKKRLLDIKFYLFTIVINYYIKAKKYNTVKYFLSKKLKLAKQMRDCFRVINSREVKTIGYDPIVKILVVAYNHINGGKTDYYHSVSREQYDKIIEKFESKDNYKSLANIIKEVLSVQLV